MKPNSYLLRQHKPWRLLILIPLLASFATMAGCATTQVKTDFCTPWAPIRPSSKDVLTDGTAKQILAHDRTGAKLCGWKPTK